MKALVLGGSGFIGSHIVRALLDKNYAVKVLLRPHSSVRALERLEVERVPGDLDDPASLKKALQGCSLLFHAAAYYPLYSLKSEEQIRKALSQIKNVLHAAAAGSGLEKIVYTSSLSTIGIPPSGLADEGTPYDPNKFSGLYYQIKYLMEQEVLQSARQGLAVTVVNPTAVFGDFDVKPTSGIFLLEIAKGKLPFLFDAKFNAVDVRDVAAAQVQAAEKGRPGERYILGGTNTTLWDFSQQVARLAGVAGPKWRLPLFLGAPLARASEYLGMYLLKQKKPLVPMVGIDFVKYGTHYDSSKAERELGLGHTPLEETVERALLWFRENGYL